MLVLDEPTNHLDHATVEQLLAVLATLEPRPAVLVVTHDTGFLRHVDQVIRMESGRVVERPGSADDPVRSGNALSSSVPRARLTN